MCVPILEPVSAVKQRIGNGTAIVRLCLLRRRVLACRDGHACKTTTKYSTPEAAADALDDHTPETIEVAGLTANSW